MKKMDNKGFSLVELIIVIAIMAVLIGILAPQFIKYVERSRNSTDVTNAQEITSAIQVYAADTLATKPMKEDTTTGTKITVNATKLTVEEGKTNTDAIKAALADAGVSNTICKSKTAWTEYYIAVTVQNNGTIEFAYTSNGTPTDGFKAAME